MNSFEKRDVFLPYALPYLDSEEINEMADAVKSNWLSRGPKTFEFEKSFAEFVGVKYAVAMNSCTAALHMALVANNIGPGDEVITSPITFVATVNVIVHVGAVPVLVDVEPDTLNIDPLKIEEKITHKTKAIIPVHFAGHACNMGVIMDIARKHNLIVLEDAAHAVYTKYCGRMIGSIGDAAAFSFYATKNLCTGEGGMFTTNDEELAERTKIISLHGMNKNAWNRYNKGGSWYYEVTFPGYKYNMNDIQAAMGLKQLEKLEKMQNIREKYAKIYSESLKEIDGIEIPIEEKYSRHAWHLYVIKIDRNILGIDRDCLIDELTKLNIGTSVHFIPIHFHPYYRNKLGYSIGHLPIAENAFEKIISLPLYPGMNENDVRYVVDAIKYIIGKTCG